MTHSKRNIIYLLLAALIAGVVLFSVYPVIDQKTGGDTALGQGTVAEQLRGIETPGKKWLNGYLGLFFRFKYLGNINWLILPLLVYFFFTIRRRERWQRALVFVWSAVAFLIAVKGFDNYRYQFTLAPFTAVMVLILLWEFLKHQKTHLKVIGFSVVAVLSIYNIYHYFDVYRFYTDLRVTVSKPHFPGKLVNYLNDDKNVNAAAKVLVINRPLFFYHTRKEGIDYHGPYGWQVVKFLERRTGSKYRTRAFRIMKEELKADYILLKSSERQVYRTSLLTEFLDCESRLVLEDRGWFLYRLRDRSLEVTLRSPAFKPVKIWFPRRRLPGRTSPALQPVFRQGKFAFTFSKSGKQNQLAVRCIEPGIKGKRRIHFGYEFNTKLLKRKIPAGKYVHLVMNASVPAHLMNRDNYMFISDYKENWDSRKTFFTTPNRRTYVVSKQVRPGSTRLIAAFRFCPASEKDEIKIKDLRLYVSNRPL